ncbi:coiled-coil domain-containing protein [Herbinix luporum]|uniref:Uncharacterized protein n=1 Tax=Herbinix luporum TaxID=1679721 RepID=A0A0K8J653_9FIRM|nr:hypothetical protein [Herbinix luporum]CUH92947.1 hypothetical protein SD1D_1401 [Herbinix luporum]
MNELVIQRHDFENAKKEIKKFSEQTTTELNLKMVDNSKGVGEFFGDLLFGRGIGLNHKVTGEELNELTSQIQTHLHSINNTQIKLIKEFGQVYSALEALDKDYIQAILVSIKATEETSQSIKETQGQIKKIVENQRKTLEELKKFKHKLDSYSHLSDIDKIWSDSQKWFKEISTLSKSVECVIESSKESAQKADAVKVALTTAEKKIETLSMQSSDFIEKLEGLDRADKIYSGKLDELVETVGRITERIDLNVDDINSLKDYKEKLSGISHLEEVDSIWKEVKEHTSQLTASEKRDEGLAIAIEKNKEEVDEKIADTVQTTNAAVESLSKRIKYAYLIAGGSAGLAIIELILLLMRVI